MYRHVCSCQYERRRQRTSQGRGREGCCRQQAAANDGGPPDAPPVVPPVVPAAALLPDTQVVIGADALAQIIAACQPQPHVAGAGAISRASWFH
jgi:hypothetical protein